MAAHQAKRRKGIGEGLGLGTEVMLERGDTQQRKGWLREDLPGGGEGGEMEGR